MKAVGIARRKLLLLLLLLLFPDPRASAQQPLLRFGVIGDSGSGNEDQLSVARQMEKFHARKPWEFVLTLGDNIYEEGDPAGFGPKFKDVYRNLMRQGVRFHATLGNHDRIHPDSRKGMAQVEDPAFGFVGRRDEYVFEAGPDLPDGRRLARFLCLNSDAWIEAIEEERTAELNERRTRLERWIAASGRYAWNILYMHHPLYSYVKWSPLWVFDVGGHGPSEALREVIEPLFTSRRALRAPSPSAIPSRKLPVDLVLAGHEHFYQKIKPQKGVHYIISGGAGKTRRGAAAGHSDVEYAEVALHFLNIELAAEELRYQAIGVDGGTIHSGVISNPLYAPATQTR